MSKKWNEIKHKSAPERVARVRERAHLASAILKLVEVRRRRGMTQAALAELIGVSQSALSQIENAENMEIMTLRRVIESMGGKLSITAEFKDEAILLT